MLDKELAQFNPLFISVSESIVGFLDIVIQYKKELKNASFFGPFYIVYIIIDGYCEERCWFCWLVLSSEVVDAQSSPLFHLRRSLASDNNFS
jgi:hypothetical protein